MGYVEANPGVHYTELMRALDLNNGTLAYHLNVLEKERFVVSRRQGLYKLFYPRLWRGSEPQAPQHFFSTGFSRKDYKPSTVQQKVVSVIQDYPGISQVEIAENLGISKQSLNYHIKKLRRAGQISVKREKGNTHCYIKDSIAEVRQE